MLRSKLLVSVATAAALASASINAQELQLEGLQRNIEIFSGVLEEALDFGQAKGLFGVSLGGVESTYLYGQGVLMEIRTPLANNRNRMGLVSLSSAMKSLQFGDIPFGNVTRPVIASGSAEPPRLALRTESTISFSDLQSEMMDKIENIDYSFAVNKAIQEATESARFLRSLGSVDEIDYEQLRSEIEGLREELRTKMGSARDIQESIRAAIEQGDSLQQATSALRTQADEMRENLKPLRDQAIAKAAELRERSEAAEEAYAAQWQDQVVEFESKLYAAMCDYGSTLRELPLEENVTVVLTGLGDEDENQRRSDKLHVFQKSDLLQCQTGDIDQATLQQRSIQYSY